MRKTEQKGITLIALVITIIVLLILAGVAISMLAGENGILKQAAEAKEKTEEKTTEEQIKLAAMDALIEGTDRTSIESQGDLEDALEAQGIKDATVTPVDGGYKVVANGVTQIISNKGNTRAENDIEKLKSSEAPVTQEKLKLTDVNGHTITIPKNFNIAAESPTEVKKGMIIEDSENNQYVWIPVFTKDQYSWGADYTAVKSTTKDTDAYYTAIKNALINTTNGYTKTYRNSSYSDVWYGNASYGKYGYNVEDAEGNKTLKYYTNGNMTPEQYTTLYNNMLKSVYENGGFYIGRYEMGIRVVSSTTEAQNITRTSMSEYTSTYTNENNTAPSIGSLAAPISKANAVPYNYITQSQAQMLANKLGEKTDYSNVTSTIMFGVQWDAVCVFIENLDPNNKATTKSEWLTENDYSKYWGNYYTATFTMNQGFYSTIYDSTTAVTWNNKSTSAKGRTRWLCTTGASNQNSSLNIYDFAGNLAEWTLERANHTDYPCISCGADLNNIIDYASYRNIDHTYYSNSFGSSRSSLYIK